MTKYKVTVNDTEHEVALISQNNSSLAFVVNGETYSVSVDPIFENVANAASMGHPVSVGTPQIKTRSKVSGDIAAPMPGVIVSIAAKEGDSVNLGSPLLVMEAMKMENSITASKAGTISKIHVKPGQQVENGQLLVSIV